ncbi:GNAT family N-acetyltransferase [Ethanoligenens sp.]|uniref:GNAT family N-acetyltransferase n=1 Tax=Ethanoligenens sp. TaxID=2099655 RepID=UPI0039EBB10A
MNLSEKRITFRTVAERDVSALLQIYLYYIRNSTATFQIADIDVEQMRQLVINENPKYHSFSIFVDGTLCGYVAYHPYREREAFSQTAEVSIYLKQSLGGQGVGTQAIQMLEPFAKNAGIHVLVALICHENTGSIRVFKKCGYQQQAYLKEVGYKFNRYLNMVVLQKKL